MSSSHKKLPVRITSFKRGVHPHDGKEHSQDMPIKVIEPKQGQKMYFPVSQHIGAPCEPIVNVGDEVVIGQKIAEPSGFVSTSIHSSVSGKVEAIKEVLTTGGSMVKAIVIENNGEDKTIENYNQRRDYTSFTRDEIINIVKESGIVGLGGAGFPTFIKLNPPTEQKIDRIIINAAECEPFLTTDYRVMMERPEKVIEGLKIALSLHPEAKGIIGIETNKPEAILKLHELTKDMDDIEIVGLVPKYPQGSEKQLIIATTGREVPSGQLPSSVGCIVMNVDTVSAICDAVAYNKPLVTRVVTWTGTAVTNPGNYECRIGTMISELSEELGGLKETAHKMIAGGPMMGMSLFSLDVAMTKTASAYLFLSENEGVTPQERNCIRCGKCVAHCPAGLLPLELNYHALQGDLDNFEKFNGLDCIECGSCSYICPSKRHLAQTIRVSRKNLMASKRK